MATYSHALPVLTHTIMVYTMSATIYLRYTQDPRNSIPFKISSASTESKVLCQLFD